MLAEVSSGRSERVSSWPTKLERSLGPAPVPTSSIDAEPPLSATASNAVARTVTTFFASEVRTVAIALPA